VVGFRRCRSLMAATGSAATSSAGCNDPVPVLDDHVSGRGSDQDAVCGVNNRAFGAHEAATTVHHRGFSDKGTTLRLSEIPVVHVRGDSELGTQVVATFKAKGASDISERSQHPAVDTAFEISSYIVGERHGHSHMAWLLPNDADMQPIMYGRTSAYFFCGGHGWFAPPFSGRKKSSAENSETVNHYHPNTGVRPPTPLSATPRTHLYRPPRCLLRASLRPPELGSTASGNV
jgi:hypothetical protein